MNNWREQFNKEFSDLDMMETMAMLKGYKKHRQGWLTTQLKTFINTLLERQREEILEMIKRCPIEETDSVKQDYTQTIYLNGEEVKQKIIDTISK